MIDLSFLTEEEQEAIMKVLQRDAELKRAEEERVRHLPEKVKDDVQLKNMSGQWFYEAKSKRHRDKIHGADIIRASMRRKPATLAEVSQNKSNKAKISWVSNVNKEVFVPPELHGVVEHQEEEELKSSSSSKTITSVLDKPEERPMKAAVSPVKQRRNPFNSTASGDNLNSGESENRPATLPQLSKKEILSLSEESQPKPNLQNDEREKHKKPSVEPTDESQKGLVKRPVPKARKLIHKATDPVSQREDFVPKPAKRTDRINGIGTPPRGILKHSSSSSSTDSEVRVSQMLDVQKKNALPTATIFEGEAEKNSLTEELEDSTQISLERLKQVRFSSSTGKGEPLQSPQLQHGREKGEFDLLESDEISSSGNDAIRSDSSGKKQISAVKPLGTYSSALQVKTIDGLQDDTSASAPCDTNRSVLLVNEALQTKTVTPKKLETLQKTSSNTLPNSNDELSVDETRENKANRFLSHESKSHKNFTDEHQLSAKTEAYAVSNTNSTSLQQGKPDLVEERDAKTTFKPEKHADELMEVADESVSKVLDWFKRSSGTEDRKHVSARSQGREPKEEMDFSTRTAVLPTEHSGPSMDGKTEVTEEFLNSKIKQQNSISPTSFISEDTQLIKERMKSKKGEEKEEQNDKSLTEFDCTRVEEHGQEIKQQNKKSNLLEHQEHKLPAQKCESEKAIQEKRRIREIRAFWERDKTIPSHGEKEVSINTNASGGGALKGLRESDKIKPTAVYLPNGLEDQSKNTLRSAELSCASQPSRNEHHNSFEFGPGHAVEKPERALPSDGEVHEYTELPKASNLRQSVGATSASTESKDEKETLKGKVAACSQQKPSFQVLSLKGKMTEKSKNQISDPSQFQSLRNFWDTGVKLQSSIDRGDVSLPNNTSSVTYERNSVSKQKLIQQQTQTSEREKTQNLDSVVCELPLGSPTLKGLNVTHTKNTDSVQLDRKPVILKPQEKMAFPEQEVKECVEKSVVSSKEHHVSLQLFQSPGDKDALKETAVDDWLCLSIEKVENKTTPLDINLPKEEAELDVFKLGLKKLEKEASEMSSSLNLKENILKGTTFHSNQCKVFERKVEQSHDICPVNQKEEIGKSTGKVNVASTDEHENKKSLRKLFREFEPFGLRHQAADKDDSPEDPQRLQAGLQNLLKETFAFQPSEYRRVGMKTSDDMNSISQTNCSVESTCQDDTGQPEEVNETTEKSVAPSKVSGLSSALEKLLKEASETPSPKPKHADSTVQRTSEMEVKNMTYEHDGELPQEIGETIEKSVAPSKVSGLSSALEKLLKEASETPPPKPKRADSTVQRTAEMEVKSMTYEHDGELPQEIGETIEKSVAPSKVSGLSSALEKLLKEASETPPPKPKRADSTVQRTSEMEVKNMTYEHDGGLPQEIGETIEKSVAPSKVSGLSSALEKLLKEASETPPPKPKHADSTVQRTAEMEVKSITYEHDGELPQEIGETMEKSVAPFKVSGLSSALEKLLKEASETPPPKPKRADSTVQRTAEMKVKSMTYEHDGELPQEIGETIEKSVAPSKVSGLSSALEKLLKEASETPPPKPKRADSTVQRTAEMEVKSMTYEHDGELPQEIGETMERSALSKAEYRVSNINLQKLPKEVSETPASVLENMDKKMQGKIQTSLTMHAPHQRERDHPQEIQETIEKNSASNTAKFSEFSCSLEKLLQEASKVSCPISKELHKQEKFGDHMFPSQKETLFMTISQPHNALSSYHTQMKIAIKGGAPEQNIKASVSDLAVSEIEASDLPKRNGAINKIEKRSMAPFDVPPLEGETNMIAIKPFKINEKGRRDESTSLDASEKNSEFKALLKFRKASTPLKDESNSSQPEGAQLCLMSQHEDNDEEEGDGSNLGSKFSDENSDSHSGTGSSTRSEEELNPVLMALKRSADRKMPSKSLEDIPSATSNKGKINNPKEEIALSAEDGLKPDQHQERNENAAGISTVPSQPDKLFSNPEKLKGLSKSVPSFLQEESDDRETDTASESSYSLGRIKKSPSSLTNLSGSSGMASLSSVSGSLMSIYSADFGNVDVKGNIQFALDYVEQLNELHIFICQCKDLAVADVKRQRSDPYVKTYLLPEKYKLGKRKTSVKKKTFNPVYNEILRYKIEKGLLKNQSLNISVWHNDTFGRNSFLGEVELDLGTWDWNDKSNKQINWFPLKPRTSTMALELENRGEMKLALQYVPHPVGGKKTLSTGEVHIWVKECHDLPLLRGNRLNSFIKCTILPDTSRKSRQKTRTVAKTTNPVFNHTMVYDGFRPEDLKEACVELTVWDHNKLANHFLGGLRIGLGTGKSYGTTVDWMDSTSDETALWEKMMNSPNTWIEDTLPLRMLMVAKLTK
ncbi:synaptotagmin-like protein 2 isoform X2 [Calonectris borealis]|uniref:synaptotagmin-like protein 2 isoform X2 n=1 Tax=Calonectris borealis TaxID=1323832 RepID=UPI003F4B2A2D